MAATCGNMQLWSSIMVLLWLVLSFNVMQVYSASVLPGIGVNWGNIASHPLPPNIVVQMLKDNGISSVKLFDSDSWTLSCLAGSGIEVMVGIPNKFLEDVASSYEHAKQWVKDNVVEYLKDKGGVDIKYVAVGNEPFLKAYEGEYDDTTFPALQNIQQALNEENLGDKIKASIPFNADVYEGDKPSQGDFRKDVRSKMYKIVKYLHKNKAPFIVNIYPFISVYQTKGFPLDYAFFDGKGKKIQDKNISYSNVFDANYDTLVWSLSKAGAPNLKILVGEVGWPTDGSPFANTKLAQRFYDGLMKKLAAKEGTPLRPGSLYIYLFGLLDEDMKSNLPGNFERHWGIFRYDGKPKFPMDLSGKGHDKMLIAAKGVKYLTKQWCVLSEDVVDTNNNLIPAGLNYACSKADCTSLTYGSSCGNMQYRSNVSYAFNMYFQMNDQDVAACDFNGLATITTRNASKGTCLFPIQIVSRGDKLLLPCFIGLLSLILVSFFMLF